MKDEKKKVEEGIAKYLDQFAKSPFSYPANHHQSVPLRSSIKSSWKKIKKK